MCVKEESQNIVEVINKAMDDYLKNASTDDVKNIVEGKFPDEWICGNTAMDGLFHLQVKAAIIIRDGNK